MTGIRHRTRTTRRSFLAGASALAAAPLLPARAATSNPNAVVIGAGAAGLAATRTLREAGHSVVLIEAGSRIGGRAHTDTSMFGVPFDLGAHWLHRGNKNPFASYGRQNGFDIYPAPDEQVLYVGDRPATAAEQRAYSAAYEAAISAMSQAGRAGRDVSPASVMPDGGVWRDTVHFVIGPWEMGKDFDHFSCTDWWSGEDGKDWFCRQGFGAVLAHSARGVEAELGTRARTIRWGGSGVTVETNKGTISAKACLVTVSTGVLAGGSIRFDPALPPGKQDAFAGITMGTYNHIALQFRDNVFGVGDDHYLLHRVPNGDGGSPRAIGTLANVSGTHLSLCEVGGAFARDLEGEGQAGMIDFGLGELRKMLGSNVDDQFIKGHATAWSRNQLTLGSYASAEPGAHHLRRALRETVGDRIWFAGEACSASEWATVAGAHTSGIEAARSLMQKV